MTIVKQKSGINHTTFLAVTSMLAALAAGLMFIEFPLPFIAPSFYEFDFSEVPVLVGTYSMGPVAGVIIELVKILVKFLIKGTSTGGVGELANFIIGCSFILPAGLIYKHKKAKMFALFGAVSGAVIMGVFSIVSNYFMVYPFYYNFMPKEAILGAYQAILPGMKSILQCLICFNMPFTMVKGFISVAITMLVYKPLSPIIKGRQ